MNSAINYYSAAQRHTDAIRDARRNPPLVRPVAPVVEREARPGLTVLLARRARRLVLRPLGV
jgi:hypothetical protein